MEASSLMKKGLHPPVASLHVMSTPYQRHRRRCFPASRAAGAHASRAGAHSSRESARYAFRRPRPHASAARRSRQVGQKRESAEKRSPFVALRGLRGPLRTTCALSVRASYLATPATSPPRTGPPALPWCPSRRHAAPLRCGSSNRSGDGTCTRPDGSAAVAAAAAAVATAGPDCGCGGDGGGAEAGVGERRLLKRKAAETSRRCCRCCRCCGRAADLSKAEADLGGANLTP
eukprot:365492-Chlamydomonas_euryale.AAC.19